jgi:hypothetical protein
VHELLADWCEMLNALLRDVANTHASCARHDNRAWVLALDQAYAQFLQYLIRDAERWSSSGPEGDAACCPPPPAHTGRPA